MRRMTSLILLFSLLITSCINPNELSGDWSYKLPNDYEIWHVNSIDIICGKKHENSLSAITYDYVLAFVYDDRYIGLMCMDSHEEYGENIYEEYSELTWNPEKVDEHYYIVDTITDELIGPLTESEYYEKYLEYMNLESIEWINTKPMPEGATFD